MNETVGRQAAGTPLPETFQDLIDLAQEKYERCRDWASETKDEHGWSPWARDVEGWEAVLNHLESIREAEAVPA